MGIDLYAAGFALIENGVRRAGCGLVLIRLNQDGRRQRRSMAFALGSATGQLASVQAARLALLALRHQPASDAVTLHVDRYVATMLESNHGRYRAVPSANAEAVTALRQIYECHNRPVFVIMKPTVDAPDCLALSKQSAIAQSNIDSGTVTDDKPTGGTQSPSPIGD